MLGGAVESKFNLSSVERYVVDKYCCNLMYRPYEKIPSIIVPSFPVLGKLIALRFLEWVQNNPGGVICLPTGKTPEHFIKWVQYFLANWTDSKVVAELEEFGLDATVKPDMASLTFVQMDEFYPIESSQHNSFNYYVKKYYIEGFGLDPDKALLIDSAVLGIEPAGKLSDYWPDSIVDLSLRYRSPQNLLEAKQKAMLSRIDQWCCRYESKIRAMGGIGFFLGGIGPDGHIGFNIKGSSHYSTTRLCKTNYETQAAAATDLGGIEVSKNRLVITVGLNTIVYNPDCVAVIMAAGAAKAAVVANAIQAEPNNSAPASVLGQLSNSKFYLTESAAEGLEQRHIEKIKAKDSFTQEDIDRAIVSLALKNNKRIIDLNKADIEVDLCLSVAIAKNFGNQLEQVGRSISDKINAGIKVLSGKRFLHTEPHHDDIMLGYFPALVRNFRRADNVHYFMTLTSGFTSVTNQFILDRMYLLADYIKNHQVSKLLSEGYFAADNVSNRNRDVLQYLDGVAAESDDVKNEGSCRRFLRNLIEIYNCNDLRDIVETIDSVITLLKSQYCGQKDPVKIQKLKGMCREWESECLWAYYGWSEESVKHLRLGFYTGDIFTEEPTYDRDVIPVLNELCRVKPDIVTLAFDPEGSGPGTHYKVLQTIAEALSRYQAETGRKDIQVWGYRNVWYRFEPWEANMFVPVSLNMFSVMQQAFMNCFISQKNASFPSHDFEGTFSSLAQKIQVQQYEKLKTCLGRSWFYGNKSPLLRATRGFVFLKTMTVEQLCQASRSLRAKMEDN